MSATQYEENMKRMLKPNSRDWDLDTDEGQIFMRNAMFCMCLLGIHGEDVELEGFQACWI
jgi:hypothetical protein